MTHWTCYKLCWCHAKKNSSTLAHFSTCNQIKYSKATGYFIMTYLGESGVVFSLEKPELPHGLGSLFDSKPRFLIITVSHEIWPCIWQDCNRPTETLNLSFSLSLSSRSLHSGGDQAQCPAPDCGLGTIGFNSRSGTGLGAQPVSRQWVQTNSSYFLLLSEKDHELNGLRVGVMWKAAVCRCLTWFSTDLASKSVPDGI